MPFTPLLHDFDDLRTFVLFVVTIYTLFSAKFLGLKNSHRQLVRFFDVCPPPDFIRFVVVYSHNMQNCTIAHAEKG